MAPAVLAALIQAAATGVGAIASHNAGKRSAEKNKEAEGIVAQQRSDNQKWWETKRSEDYTKRADVQAAINRQRDLLNEHYKTSSAVGKVAGATENQQAQQKESANKSLSDTMTNLAEAGARQKDADEQQYLQRDAQLAQQQVAIKTGQADAIAKAGAQSVDMINSASGNIAGNAELMQQGANLVGKIGKGGANADYNDYQDKLIGLAQQKNRDDLDDLLSGFKKRN